MNQQKLNRVKEKVTNETNLVKTAVLAIAVAAAWWCMFYSMGLLKNFLLNTEQLIDISEILFKTIFFVFKKSKTILTFAVHDSCTLNHVCSSTVFTVGKT